MGNPGKRRLPPVAIMPARPPTAPPAPPRVLGVLGTALWARCWTAGARWMDAAADIEVVLMMCEQADERGQLRAAVLRDAGVENHRARVALRALDAQIMSGLAACGFTPADRARMGVGEAGEVDFLEQLRARRAGSA